MLYYLIDFHTVTRVPILDIVDILDNLATNSQSQKGKGKAVIRKREACMSYSM